MVKMHRIEDPALLQYGDIPGYKTFRKKKIQLYDIFMTTIFLSNFVYEFSKGRYVLFDLAYRVFSLPEHFKTLNKPPESKKTTLQYHYDLLIYKINKYLSEKCNLFLFY